MKRILILGAAAAALLASAAYGQTAPVSVPNAGIQVTFDSATAPKNVTITVGAKVTTIPIPPGSVTPPPPPPPPGGVTWVYHNGAFLWAGDWSSPSVINYKDTAGIPPAGPFDISVKPNQWGIWQPYFNGDCQQNKAVCFDTTPYTYLIFSIKATKAGQVLKSNFMSSGDTQDGLVLTDLSAYCGALTVGAWANCKVPLAAYKFTNTSILKFAIGDETGNTGQLWYLAEVGFQ